MFDNCVVVNKESLDPGFLVAFDYVVSCMIEAKERVGQSPDLLKDATISYLHRSDNTSIQHALFGCGIYLYLFMGMSHLYGADTYDVGVWPHGADIKVDYPIQEIEIDPEDFLQHGDIVELFIEAYRKPIRKCKSMHWEP